MYKTKLTTLKKYQINYRSQIFFILLILTTFFGCSTSINLPLYEYPNDWKESNKRDSTINYYSNFLSGKKIFVDPGHGGEDRRNKNKNGDVVEADVNLRVALTLRDYLTKAGVNVEMSRESDDTIPLAFRSEIANKSNADLFVSIHHNAPGRAEDNYTNYTSVYYHAKENDYEYEPSERDIAKYIQRDLSYVMRNSGGLGSFDGTYSDYNIYPGEGFSVLRRTTIPAVLVECAFHTNRIEELRLNTEEFNQIQAWGIFRGIGKYYRTGFPKIEMINDSTKNSGKLLSFTFLLRDSSGINPRSIIVYYNKSEIDFKFDKKSNMLSVQIPVQSDGNFPLRIICANKNGNHNQPFNKSVNIINGKVSID